MEELTEKWRFLTINFFSQFIFSFFFCSSSYLTKSSPLRNTVLKVDGWAKVEKLAETFP